VLKEYEAIVAALLSAPLWLALSQLFSRRIASRYTYQKLAMEQTLRLVERQETVEAALRQEARELNEAKGRAEEELDQFRAEAASMIDTLRAERRDLEAEVKRLTVELERHEAERATLAELRAAEAASEALAAENLALKAQIDRLNQPGRSL
jgi:hypothetical protein